jgi:hypothetical protein
MSDEKGRGAAAYVISLADRRSLVAVAVAVGSVAGVIAVIIHLWHEAGDVQISSAGWVAMAFGVLVTLGLGIALMALIFISSRRGYDEPAALGIEPDKPSLRPPHLGPRRRERAEAAVPSDPSP